MVGRPIGEAFTVKLEDGSEVTYHISPRVFSDETRDALLRIRRERRRNAIFDDIKDFRARSKSGEIDTELANGLIRKASEGLFSDEFESADFEKSLVICAEMLQTREGKVAALTRCCEEVNTPAEAAKVVDAANDLDLYAALMRAGQEGLEAAGNLSSPQNEQERSPNDAPTRNSLEASLQTSE